jgi:anti-sigma factor RsiW
MSQLQQLTCQELVELVTDYLEGALEPAAHARFEEHVAGCDGCDTYLEQIRLTISLVGRLRPEHLGPDAEERLLDAFRAWGS